MTVLTLTAVPGPDGELPSAAEAPPGSKPSAAGQRWQQATKTVILSQGLSQRLLSLRDQLGEAAFVEWQQLQTMKSLGQGSFARVSQCKYSKTEQDEEKVVAVKQMRTELLNSPQDVKNFVSEVKLLRTLKHRYIVEFLGCGWSRETEDLEAAGGAPPTEQQLFFLQEYMEGGTLNSLVMKAMTGQGKVYRDEDALRWALQIAQALEYLHSRRPKVVHRDLKLENVLLTSTKPALADAKLADFGLARLLQSIARRSKSERLERVSSLAPSTSARAQRSRSTGLERRLSKWASQAVRPQDCAAYRAVEMTAATGSLGFMAPEVFRGEQYDEKADVFSYAVVLYDMFYRTIPTVHVVLNGGPGSLRDYAASVSHGYRPPLGRQAAPGIRALISRCWEGLPHQRPSMAEVVKELQALQQDPGGLANDAKGGGACCSVM